MKPHEYLRMVFSFRGKSSEECQKALIALEPDERREMSLCMLEFMRFMIDLDSELSNMEDKIKSVQKGMNETRATETTDKTDISDGFEEELRNLFRKHDL